MAKKYVIIPGCSDLNRGDQALVWETKRIAENAGYKGEYYLTTEANEPVEQSINEGLHIIKPIMEHPSRVFKSKENISYSNSLKIKWGIVALWDLFTSLFYFSKPTRKLIRLFISKEKKVSLDVFEDSEVVFIKGGGLLQTYGGITSTYSMYFWVFHVLLAEALGKPVYVMPNSMGPFEGPYVKKIARKALSKCALVTSREHLTQEMVKKDLALDIENFPDLAFYLPKTEMKKKDVLEKYNLPADRKLVAFTMRPYRFPQSSDPKAAYEGFKEELDQFIHWLYTQGYMPVIVEHTLAVNAHENDGACIKDVTLKLKKDEYRIISDVKLNCHDLKAIYGCCDYIVGTRFHSVIFSLGCGVPVIAIAYAGNKTQGIMHDIGLDEYVVRIGDVTCEGLKNKFENLTANEAEVKSKISDYQKYADGQYDILCGKIKS